MESSILISPLLVLVGLAPGYLFVRAFAQTRLERIDDEPESVLARQLTTVVIVSILLHAAFGLIFWGLSVAPWIGGWIPQLDVQVVWEVLGLPGAHKSPLTYDEIIARSVEAPLLLFGLYMILVGITGFLAGRQVAKYRNKQEPLFPFDHGLAMYERAEVLIMVDVLVEGGTLYSGLHYGHYSPEKSNDGAIHLFLPSRLLMQIPDNCAEVEEKKPGASRTFYLFKSTADRQEVVGLMRRYFEPVAALDAEAYLELHGPTWPDRPENPRPEEIAKWRAKNLDAKKSELLDEMLNVDDEGLIRILRQIRDITPPALSIPWNRILNIHIRRILLSVDEDEIEGGIEEEEGSDA